MRKPFKDLNLSSSFLFAAALSDPDTCRIVLEIILGRKISKVNVKAEHSILLSSDSRCVRLDVNARDEYDVNYDIEASYLYVLLIHLEEDCIDTHLLNSV